MGELEAATLKSIQAAIKGGVLDKDLSAGPIQAILALAAKIDHWDTVVMYAKEDAQFEFEQTKKPARPKVPEHDGTSHIAYLRYAEQLNIMPKKGAKPKAQGDSALARLRAVPDA